MAALRPPGGGETMKDRNGTELKEGSLVEDEIFGPGFARGVVACVGGGFNILIDWCKKFDNDLTLKPASRGTQNLTRVTTTVRS